MSTGCDCKKPAVLINLERRNLRQMVLLVYLINFLSPYARQEYHEDAHACDWILKILIIPDVIRINRLRRNLRQFVSVRSSLFNGT